MLLSLTAINRYPVKSCRGQALEEAQLEPWGLAGDRRWMLVDDAGETVTAREHPRLLLVRPELTAGGLRLTAPELEELSVAIPAGPAVPVRVHGGAAFASRPADPAAHAWFGKVVGMSARLMYQDDPTLRPTNPAFTQPEDRVSLADGYPLLLTTEDSLAALNELIADGRFPDEGPVPMRRFRPNVVVRGAPAWEEDHWRRLRIGGAVFRAVKGCARCVLTTIDPDTAQLGREPLATLVRHRRWDGQSWFGMNLVPDSPGVRIRVGDEVEVLGQVDSDGPPR